jgi:hypothetical protein
MRFVALLGFAALLAGCTKAEDRSVGAAGSTDSMAAPAARTAEAGTISLSDLAGTWKIRSSNPDGSKPVETEVRATADRSGWTMTGPDRKSVPVRVIAVAGDSVVTEAGPYGSFVVKGAQVTTRTVYRLDGDKLVGTTEARYKIGSRDSVAQRRNEGTRVR